MSRKLLELLVENEEAMSLELALALIIRERRQKLGLSQEGLEGPGISQSQASRIENGAQKVYISMFVELAHKLDLEPWQLLKMVTDKLEEHNRKKKG